MLERHRTFEVSDVARTLGTSLEAIEIYRASDVIDLHLDSYIWTRIFGYDMHARNEGHPLARVLGGRFLGQTDLPRALESGLTGGIWVITTLPFKPSRARRDAFFENLEGLQAVFQGALEKFALVKTVAEYEAARASGRHGAFLGIQGGNALDYDLDDLDRLDGRIIRITLVHLTNSKLGATSSPYGRFMNRGDGLTDLGRDYIRRLNEHKILVDLAHISRRAFFDAVAAHDKSQPLIVTHTGIAGVHEHWRNLTDEQLRAIADTGGTIGIMLQKSFLGRGNVDVETVVDHIDHVVRVVGEDFVSIGTDYDGAIVPPKDLPTPFELPRIVDAMLRRGYGADRIHKVLGTNFLRVVRELRG